MASVDPSDLKNIQINITEENNLVFSMAGRYSIDEIMIDGLSLQHDDLAYVNGTIILIERGFMVIPLNSTLARSLIESGAYIKLETNNRTIIIIMYPMGNNPTKDLLFNMSSSSQVNESPTQWETRTENQAPSQVRFNRFRSSLLYAITLIVSLVILLYYLEMVRKVGRWYRRGNREVRERDAYTST
jgi:hypothetical protein